jgi:hypothetical protein
MKLESLEYRYGKQVTELGLDLYGDTCASGFILQQRMNYRFYKIFDLIKRRASFFGIFTLADKVELN